MTSLLKRPVVLAAAVLITAGIALFFWRQAGVQSPEQRYRFDKHGQLLPAWIDTCEQ